MTWQSFIVPALAGLFSFAGAFAAVRVDIRWIKETLKRHEGELRTLHQRISRI